MNEYKRTYLHKDRNGNYLDLDEELSGIFSNRDDRKWITLLVDEKVDLTTVFEESDVRRRIYFFDNRQRYCSYWGHPFFGYREFREANPDLKDVYSTDNTKTLKKMDKEMSKKEKQWREDYDKLSVQEQSKIDKWKDNPYSQEERCKKVHEYNDKKNGWAKCQTHMGSYIFVTVDMYDKKLLNPAFRIRQKDLDVAIKLAPYHRKWTEFSKGDGLRGEGNWFPKSKLPDRAYKLNTYEHKKYIEKNAILKKLEKGK